MYFKNLALKLRQLFSALCSASANSTSFRLYHLIDCLRPPDPRLVWRTPSRFPRSPRNANQEWSMRCSQNRNSLGRTTKALANCRAKLRVITGADSGIGRAVAVHFAREGADVCVMYLDEHKDAEETKQLVEGEGRKCMTIAGDIGDHQFCKDSINQVAKQLGKIDILVNNAAEQHFVQDIKDISPQQVERTFRTNIFSMFFLSQAALQHMGPNSCIINTTSITAYKGYPQLLDYSSTKGAIVSFTCSLALMLVEKKIRVNAVAPGPIWTPLIPATFPPDYMEQWKESCPMKRPAHPSEVAPSYVFLASEDSTYFSDQVLHPNGGTVVNA